MSLVTFHKQLNKRLKIVSPDRVVFCNPNTWDLALMGGMIYFSKDEIYNNDTPSNQQFNLTKEQVDWANCDPAILIPPTSDEDAIEVLSDTFYTIN